MDTALYEALRSAIQREEPVATATVVEGVSTGAKLLIRADGTTIGSLAEVVPELDVVADALAMLARTESGIRSYAERQIFIETFAPPPTLFIVGAVHIAIPLVTYAKTLGFRTVVVDARGAFATPERFDHADELIHAWPDEILESRLTINSFVVLLTHDPKLDDPALVVALPSPARYVGALGSPKTHAKRVERLRSEGMQDEHLARLHAPIGLKIGATTPEEIAVSIIAEIVAARHSLTSK
ncbi:MAG: XdhC/CoxI family protein [Roseiflexaceae bacterium]|nr:XdhC/CoxI family protein [Roseiflexaceae bacterium]